MSDAGWRLAAEQLRMSGCRGRISFWLRTKAGATHALRAIPSGAGAVVAPSGVLTDLIVSALVRAIMTLIDVYKRSPHINLYII